LVFFSVGLEVIDEFFGVFILGIGEFEFEFAFFGAQDDRLTFHAADHVEGSAWLAAQGHLQQVFLDAGLDGLAQLGLDLEEAIGGTQSADALVGAFVVIILDPDFDAFARGIETFELRASQELLPHALPEAFDLAQGHGMVRA